MQVGSAAARVKVAMAMGADDYREVLALVLAELQDLGRELDELGAYMVATTRVNLLLASLRGITDGDRSNLDALRRRIEAGDPGHHPDGR
jgi:glutamate/tyrosine decarboxylase-like PLP-dependent enzyme